MSRRADTGNYFGCAVQPAREKAKQALEEYKKGNKDPLAEILARTAGHMGREANCHMDLVESFYAQNQLAGEMVDLMDRDKGLRDLAAEKYKQHEDKSVPRNALGPELAERRFEVTAAAIRGK